MTNVYPQRCGGSSSTRRPLCPGFRDMSQSSRPGKGSSSIELILGLVVTGMILTLQARFFWNAGGLWRDEAVSVHLAQSGSLVEVYKDNLRYDSFPVLWITVLHAWIKVGAGASDLPVRVLGLIVSVLSLAA